MMPGTRKSGIDVIGDVPWSIHFGLFYKSTQDLVNILVPYFVAGLKNNEFCMWVTAEPLNVEDAKSRMAEALPDFDVYLDKGQIEIIPYTEWYTINGVFDGKRVLNGWVEKLRKAQERGFSGLRLTGNESWLDQSVWKDFIDYEQMINDVIGQYNMLAVCSYSLDKCDANDILDVVSTHQFALTRRNGDWKIIEDQGQKKARKALQESEVRFHSLIQNSSDIIRVLDRNGLIIYDSLSSQKVLGYPPGYTLGKSPYEFIHHDDLDRVRNDLGEVYDKKNDGNYTEFRIRKADGEYLDVESVGVNMIGVPGVDGIVITTRDITERKRAEELLRNSEARFRSYFDLPLIGIGITSVDKNWIRVNDKLCEILGYSREELFHHTWAELTHPDDVSKNVELFNRLLSGEIDGYTLDKRFIRKNGEIANTIISVGCVRRFDGTIDYFVTTVQDISYRKRIEQELLDAKSQAELYVDLMGHDINNMNQIGMGFIELALDTLNLDENSRLLLSKPMSAFEGSSKLIDNVRKLQREKSGDLSNTEMDIGQKLSDVQYHYSHLHGGNVSINYIPVIGYMVMANELLYDLFSNLVGNAIKHSNGHPVINIKVEQIQENNTDYHKISIEDNGPGIPDDLKTMIFNRRLRGGSKAKGSGIGLFLVKTLVDDYDGRVWAEDRIPGDYTKGARFVVMLPAL
jgi:PAS domain S-box-containing protein